LFAIKTALETPNLLSQPLKGLATCLNTKPPFHNEIDISQISKAVEPSQVPHTDLTIYTSGGTLIVIPATYSHLTSTSYCDLYNSREMPSQ
jgi:hypothetical protein